MLLDFLFVFGLDHASFFVLAFYFSLLLQQKRLREFQVLVGSTKIGKGCRGPKGYGTGFETEIYYMGESILKTKTKADLD